MSPDGPGGGGARTLQGLPLPAHRDANVQGLQLSLGGVGRLGRHRGCGGTEDRGRRSQGRDRGRGGRGGLASGTGQHLELNLDRRTREPQRTPEAERQGMLGSVLIRVSRSLSQSQPHNT